MENKIKIPEIVRTIANVLKDNGNQAFVVGGAVRDAVMGVDCEDIDIATDLFVTDVIELFKDLDFVTDIKTTGDKFPVARIFTTCDHEFEIATFRADIGEGEDTDFEVVSDIDGDVHRRDFTFNALFADADTGEIVDLVDGINDLKKKILRFVGDPIQCINEDRTRLLRLTRFKERFSFDIADFDLIKRNNALINGLEEKDQVKKEMIVTEVVKGFKQAKDKISFFQTLSDLGLLTQVFPKCIVKIPTISFSNLHLMLFQVLESNTISFPLAIMKEMKWSNESITIMRCLKFLALDDPQFVESSSFARLVKLVDSSGVKPLLEDFSTLFDNDKAKFIKKFITFELTVKNTDFPELKPSKELGQAIHEAELELFRNHEE